MDLHCINKLCLLSTLYHQPLSTLSHNSQKLLLSTRYTTGKSHGLHDIKADILKLAYHHPRRFLWAFKTIGEFQGMDLW